MTAIVLVFAIALVTLAVSRFMWWACGRSAIWSMAAGALLAVLALVGALAIAWVMTAAMYGR